MSGHPHARARPAADIGNAASHYVAFREWNTEGYACDRGRKPGALRYHPSHEWIAMRIHTKPFIVLSLFGSALGAQQPVATQPAFPRPVGQYEVEIEKDIMVPMRDGVRLATDIYRPMGVTGPLPTVLIRLPYNKSGYRAATGPANYFASHGYAVAVQDVRGKFASEGTFRVYEGDVRDWPDMFDWLTRQSWSTGKVGTFGCSYLGEGQILAMQERHPAHVAAIPQAAGGNLGRVPGRRQFWGSVEGGTNAVSINFGWMPMFASIDKGARPLPQIDFAQHLRTLPLIDMTDRVGSPSWDWRNFLERSPDDPWWDAQGYLTMADSASTAALHVSSWFDLAAEALMTADIFRKNGSNARARENQYAIIAPTVHCAFDNTGNPTIVGELNVHDARLGFLEIYLKWFNYWLKGEQNGVLSMPKFQYFVIGKNEWRGSPVWPVAGMRATPFYLHSRGGANTSSGNGRLTTTRASRQPADTFTYDPANPIPSRGGSICCTGNPKDQPGSFNQADLESRSDMLVYTGELLREGLELTGPISAELFVSSSAKDTDFTIKLLDVFPDGRVMNIVEGVTRARYRDGFDKQVFMTPGNVYRVPVDLHATSWYFPPGHRVRIEVSSSNFPRFDRNLNTGGRNYDETRWEVAKNTIHHSARYPSRVILPVVRQAAQRRRAAR